MLKLAVLMVAVAAAVAKPGMMLGLDEEWDIFKRQHGKLYEGQIETYRRGVWEKNVAFIQSHNLQADRGVHSFRLGMNHLGDLTREEINKMLNGYTMKTSENIGATFMAPSNVGDLPTEVDWRKEGYVTPIKNQGQCGSCWSFSATGSLEGQTFKKTGKLVSLSEQNLVDCSGKEGNQGCAGGLMDQAFQYIKQNRGIDTEASYPYTAKDGTCHFSRANVGSTDVGFTDIPRDSESSLQQAVATVGPVSVAIDASRSTFHFYKSGVYNDPECSSTKLDHGVLAVGYGTSQGSDYWLVKNSWGTMWGLEGYIQMSRNQDNQCGIATVASYPLV
ncbi:procathepsin L [Patella vulgata]|uniref:procathepsin L n=1 Tax=Patella vulgata TaxID=6465 RepID=UPI0021802D30|nr:procathepsin L [Patella vulgata]